MTSATHPLPANPVETFDYDAVGNRLLRDGEVTQSVFDAANRLTEDETFLYTYDLNGNLETKTEKVGGAVTTYSYDAENRLVRIDFPDLTVATYRYDGLGRRIEKDVDGVITRYVYDGENIVMEFDGVSTLLARYSHGDQTDQPLSVERAGQSFFYHADHRGSVRLITDAAGFVVNSYEYDSYGNIESSVEGIANPFTYTGREFDAESGLYHYRARYYDAEIGRFLKEDPIGFAARDLNLYRYVLNNPLNLNDPFGLEVGGAIISISARVTKVKFVKAVFVDIEEAMDAAERKARRIPFQRLVFRVSAEAEATIACIETDDCDEVIVDAWTISVDVDVPTFHLSYLVRIHVIKGVIRRWLMIGEVLARAADIAEGIKMIYQERAKVEQMAKAALGSPTALCRASAR